MAIEGQVTLDGTPLDQGSIRFEPQDTSIGTSSAAILSQGSYKIPVAKGLAPGVYRVFVTAATASHDGRTADEIMNNPWAGGKELIPEKYNLKSELTAEVKAEGRNQFDFALETK